MARLGSFKWNWLAHPLAKLLLLCSLLVGMTWLVGTSVLVDCIAADKLEEPRKPPDVCIVWDAFSATFLELVTTLETSSDGGSPVLRK